MMRVLAMIRLSRTRKMRMRTMKAVSLSLLQLLLVVIMSTTTTRVFCSAFSPIQVTKATQLSPRFHHGSSRQRHNIRLPFDVRVGERCQNKRSSSSVSSVNMIMIEYDDFLPQPSPLLNSTGVVNACMETMVLQPNKLQGLEVCFHFSSDPCRAALGGSLERFSQYATNPIFGYLVHCVAYDIISVGPLIQGTPMRGAMQTVLLDAHQQQQPQAAGETTHKATAKRFLWTLQQERRPPRQGCWLIHEVIYVNNAYMLTT